MRMFKKSPGSNGAKIGIVFHCQDTEEDNPFNEEEMYEDQSTEETEEEEMGTAVRFAVTVSKGGKTVVLQCRSAGEVSVEAVTVRDGDAESTVVALAGGEGLHAALYQVSFCRLRFLIVFVAVSLWNLLVQCSLFLACVFNN